MTMCCFRYKWSNRCWSASYQNRRQVSRNRVQCCQRARQLQRGKGRWYTSSWRDLHCFCFQEHGGCSSSQSPAEGLAAAWFLLPSLPCIPRPNMASRRPTPSREAGDSAPGNPEAGINPDPGPEVFCKLCLSEQPPAATRELQSCNCVFCSAVRERDTH